MKQEFKIGDLVKCKCNNFSSIGVIKKTVGKYNYSIGFDDRSTIICPQSDIRSLTFREFAWYSDPTTGWPKIGKNSAIPVLFSIAMSISFIIASFSVEGLWSLVPAGMGVAIIVANYVGLRYNYTGKWI
jgi:hypothetical protein